MAKYDDEADLRAKKDTAIQEQRIRANRAKGMSEREATIAGLVNMKRKEAVDGGTDVAPVSKSEGPKYPYGLRFRLEDEDITKLGFKDMPEMGSTCKFTLEATPESISQNQNSDGKEHRCLEFQITDMKWDGEGKSKDTKEEAEEPVDNAEEEVAEGEY